MNLDIKFEDTRYPLPEFSKEDAILKVRIAEDAWNNKNPEKIATAYSLNSQWRNRDEFVNGRDQIIQFLSDKWNKELEYRLIKELWAYEKNRIAVRYVYEWHNKNGNWFRSHGNENWAFNEKGLMTERHASINDVAILESERKFLWPQGPRPADHPSLSELGM
ncbi:nuclear transport factor 2 family protein [Oceaniserpentilla sp. 4NH20-0058]|uniref:nuclear transport factor 2 family protein n=1 Tax=Oceaniserpentilla sp. 4NH20-0058 TaxID=3127660 RepID=UPI003105CF59